MPGWWRFPGTCVIQGNAADRPIPRNDRAVARLPVKVGGQKKGQHEEDENRFVR